MTRQAYGARMENRPGMILVVALLIMTVMSIIGAVAMTTSRIDIQVSHNTKVSRQAFYCADGGLEMAPKFIRSLVELGTVPALDNVSMNSALVDEVMGYVEEADAQDRVSPSVVNPDVTVSGGDTSVDTDIDRDITAYMAGSGVEFGSGAEGAGAGQSGGVIIYYDLESVGQAPRSARSRVDAYYRYVVGVAGGK